MRTDNYIDEELLSVERPNLRESLGIESDAEMQEYLQLYNTYNNLLIQYVMDRYCLADADRELEGYGDAYIPVADSEKDLYQHAANGYLRYYYLRNDIYVERLTAEDKKYLLSLTDTALNAENTEFVARTYLNVILEDDSMEGRNIAYGPNNLRFYKPSGAVIAGVRYDQFKGLPEDDAINLFSTRMGQLALLNSFIEYKVKRDIGIPFSVIIYDEFSVNRKNRSEETGQGASNTSKQNDDGWRKTGPLILPREKPRGISVTFVQTRNGCGESEPRTFSLEKGRPVIFGRAPSADVVINDQLVSRKHFSLDFDGERLFITDLYSRNGTEVNGKRLMGGGPQWLQSKDTVLIGRTFLRFCFGEEK